MVLYFNKTTYKFYLIVINMNIFKLLKKTKLLLSVIGLSSIVILSIPTSTIIKSDHHFLKAFGGVHAPHIIKRNPTRVGNGDDRLLNPTECLKIYNQRCYSSKQYNEAYGVNSLFKNNITGKGSTILIVDAGDYGDIQKDLDTFDKVTGLPNTTVEVKKFGNLTFDSDWAIETALDVEYAHSVAPDAKIVLAETSVADDIKGIVHAELSLINSKEHYDVMSQSFGWSEKANQEDPSIYKEMHTIYNLARTKGTTVLAASGDAGSYKGEEGSSYPATDEYVTAVGGTQMELDDAGKRLNNDTAWNLSGGGLSTTVESPKYQKDVSNITGGKYRGVPDISMSASSDAPCQVYQSVVTGENHWLLVGGTSEASPIFAGVIALTDQKLGHSIGFVNRGLYKINNLDKSGVNTGVQDVTSGSNGYPTGKDYDLATGIGTIRDATTFIDTLIKNNN